MYHIFPVKTQVTPTIQNGTHIQIDMNAPGQDVPADVNQWLQKLGWGNVAYDPDTTEPLYQKAGNADVGTMYFRWYEAIAWEWYMMMSLGGVADET